MRAFLRADRAIASALVLIVGLMTAFLLPEDPRASRAAETQAIPTSTATMPATSTPTRTPVPTRTPTPTATPIVWNKVAVPWAVNCEDRILQNGFVDRGYCVPGLISKESWYRSTNRVVVGNLSSYDPGLMRGAARVRGMDLDGYRGGMSSISCGDLGKSAWIALPPDHGEWIGPFLVVDCSQRNHIFVTAAILNIAGEISNDVALDILDGRLVEQNVAFRYGLIGYGDRSTWAVYSAWFLSTLSFNWNP